MPIERPTPAAPVGATPSRVRSLWTGKASSTGALAACATVFSALFCVDSSALLLPRDLDPNDTNQVGIVPSDEDLSAWLRCIAVADHAAKILLMTPCCCGACGA